MPGSPYQPLGYQPTNYQPTNYDPSGPLSGQILQEILPSFDFAWAPNTNCYGVGDAPAWGFTITRTDGGLVPSPTAASLTYSLPDGSIGSVATLYASSGTSAAALVVAGVPAALPESGQYELWLQVTLDPGDGSWPVQVRSARQPVTAI
jgi:hypothetical protein